MDSRTESREVAHHPHSAAHPAPEGRPAELHGPGGHPHPRQGEYIRIAVILVIITAIEVGVYYVEALTPLLVPILLILSAVKFALVVLFFMHLKFDNKLFSLLFTGPLLLMIGAFLALVALFSAALRVVPH